MMLASTKTAELALAHARIGNLRREQLLALARMDYPLAKKMQRKVNFQKARIVELETGEQNPLTDEP